MRTVTLVPTQLAVVWCFALCGAGSANGEQQKYSNLPWHLVDIDWELPRDVPFESYSIDVTSGWLEAGLPLRPLGCQYCLEVVLGNCRKSWRETHTLPSTMQLLSDASKRFRAAFDFCRREQPVPTPIQLARLQR